MTAYEMYYDEFRRVFPKIEVDRFVRKPVSIDNLSKAIKTELERMDDWVLVDMDW